MLGLWCNEYLDVPFHGLKYYIDVPSGQTSPAACAHPEFARTIEYKLSKDVLGGGDTRFPRVCGAAWKV